MRKTFKSGMQRDVNTDKPRFDLLIPEDQPLEDTMLYRWAMHLTMGAKKYDDRNWEQATGKEELDRFKESAFRHFMQWYTEEDDEDHAAAVYFNICGAEYVKEIMKWEQIQN